MKREIFKTEIEGKELKIEINDLSEQASGSVLVQSGDTVVMANVVMSKSEREGIDFFPLSVEYEEKFYAAGKILGSRFLRRESRPSDEAILTARFIDRSIRPRFPKGLKKEVQMIVTCLSWDGENAPDILGLIAASLALSISNIPWSGPIAALRLGRKDGKFLVNPTYTERTESEFDLTVAGLESEFAKHLGNDEKDKILINMMEAEGSEIEEGLFAEAIEATKPYLEKIINFQKEITNKVGKEKIVFDGNLSDKELEKEIKEFIGDKLEDSLFQKDKTNRMEDANDLKEELIVYIEEKHPGENKTNYINDFFEQEIDRLVHENILEKDRRVDGRKLDELRKIETEVSILPRPHGSGLFVRGQTKTLSVVTLGAPGDVKLVEGIESVRKKRFMHHYNFPPYSSGEVKPLRGPGRREIGHGMLAEKAISPMLPTEEDFPYTIRIVTEILSSNGSTSQASMSSSSLALMDAGVPIKKPVAGIAMGLMSDYKGKYKIVTDIQGPEDHYGDMDFKIAGTRDGITAVQMDVKIEGVGKDVIKQAVAQAKTTRIKILDEMKKTIDKPRETLSPYAPRIIVLQINPDKIRDVIGPGGKMINEIIDACGVSIDIEDTGKILITSADEASGDKASAWVKDLTREVKAGEMFQGTVKRIMDFGAFVEVLPGQEGLVHISQLADHRVEKVEDVVRLGEVIPVKVIGIDEQGRINLSHKDAK